MAEELADYEKHVVDVRATNSDERNGVNIAFCGKDVGVFEWAFVDADHLVHSNFKEDRLVACPECKKKIIEILNIQ